MLFYLCFGLSFLLFFTAVQTEADEPSRVLAAKLFFFAVFLFTALRSPEVGNDTIQFYNAYSRIREIPWTERGSERYEAGFFALCKLLGMISPHPQTLLFFTAWMISFSVSRFLRLYSRNVSLGCLLFLFLNLWAVYMNLMRQVLAMCIILFFLESLLKGRKMRFFFGVFLASLFHRSAWICLIMLVMYGRRFTYMTAVFFVPFTLLCFWQYDKIFILATLLLNRYSGYISSERFGGSNYFGMLLNVCVCLAILLYGIFLRRRDAKSSRQVQEALPADFQLFLLLCCLFCYILGTRMYILSRVSPYFTIFYLPWLGMEKPLVQMEEMPLRSLDGKISGKALKRCYPLGPFAVVFISMIYFCVIHFFRPEWQGVVPYRFFW